MEPAQTAPAAIDVLVDLIMEHGTFSEIQRVAYGVQLHGVTRPHPPTDFQNS